MRFLRYLWTRQRWPFLAFLALSVALLWVASRFVLSFLWFHDPAHHNQALEPWMTPRYVSLSYQLPPEIVFPILGIDPDGPDRKIRLGDILVETGLTLDELEELLEEAQERLEEERENRREGDDR